MTAISSRTLRRLAANDNAGDMLPAAAPSAWPARLEPWRDRLLEHADAVFVVVVAAGLATVVGMVPV
jgi:hypothetical protein